MWVKKLAIRILEWDSSQGLASDLIQNPDSDVG